MVNKFLKIAGVKNKEEFYKKYPTEAAFFKAHPEARGMKVAKDGGQQKKLKQLTSYEGDIDNTIPIAQTGLDLARSMRASSDNVAPRRNYEKEEQDKVLNKKQALQEINKKQSEKRSSVGKARTQSLDEQTLNKQRKQQYVQSHPYATLDDQGNIVQTSSDRTIEGKALPHTTAAGVDKAMTHAQHAGEAAGLITGLGGAARTILRNAAESGTPEYMTLNLSDEEMAQAMREIEEANIDPGLLDFNPNPTAEELAERVKLKGMFREIDAKEAAKTLEDDITKLKARAEFGPQDLESSAGKQSVTRDNISDLLGNVGIGQEDSGFQMYERGHNLFDEYFPGYLKNTEPYTGKQAFSTIKPNRYGGITHAQDGAPIGSYMSSPMQQNNIVGFGNYMDSSDKLITGSTQKERDDQAYKQAQLAASQKSSSGGGGGGFGNVLNMASKFIGKAKFGTQQTSYGVPANVQNPYAQTGYVPGQGTAGIQNYTPTQTGLPTTSTYNPQGTFNLGSSGQQQLQNNFLSQGYTGVGSGKSKKPFNPLGAIPIAGQIYGGIKQIKEAKNQEREARKQAQLSGLVKTAGLTQGEPIKRKYVRPEDQVINQNEMFPTYGVGTNYIAEDGAQVTRGGIGGNPTEIQNMYNPYNLFKDLGYEPLEDSEKIKQYQKGGLIDASGFSQIGQSLGAMVGGGGQGTPGGWSQALGAIPGPIGMVGGIVGSVIDGKQQAKIKHFQDEAQRNVVDTAMQQGMQGIHNQFSNIMEDGGYISHDWQPQVIASFGGNRVSNLLKKDPMMDTLRTGGHITQNETEDMGPVSSMAMGGEMKTHWGGYAEPISYNPFLPEGGETVMFRGQSHDESDGKGNTGIGVTYGDNPVEVERGEPAVKLKDGGTGEDNMVVYGNLKIPNQYLSEIGDPKAKGKKFKNYVADLSKQEARHNKTVEKNLNIIDALSDITSFDQMKFFSAKANIDGANMKLKQIADKKMNAASVQNAINEAAEEHGLDADALAKGKFKLDKNAMNEAAKWGKAIKKAQNGTLSKVDALPTVPSGQSQSGSYWGGVDDTKVEEMKKNNPWYDWTDFDPSNTGDVKRFQKAFNKKAKEVGNSVRLEEDDKLGKQTVSAKAMYDNTQPVSSVTPTQVTIPTYQQTSSSTAKIPYHYPVTPYKGSKLLDVYREVLPYIRPTNQEPLDPTQMYGEMYALATNQLDPVQAQLYRPLLEQPYDISLQDQLNANQADFNAIQRQTGYNPAAAATLAGQKYAANSKVLADQFRMNQEEKAGVYNRNRATLNDAQLKNLAALDQQMVRQETAKSRTKEVGQAALNSISDKIMKQKLANRTLGVYENLYNYRFDKSGRAINMNAPFQPTIPNVLPVYDNNGNIVGYQQTGKTNTSTGINPTAAAQLKAMNAANTAQTNGYVPLPDPNDFFTEDELKSYKKGGKTPARNRDILRAMKNL